MLTKSQRRPMLLCGIVFCQIKRPIVHVLQQLELLGHFFCCASCSFRYFSFSTSRQSGGSGSLPSVFRTPPAKADLPAYNWYPSPDCSVVSRLLKVMGWFPRNRLRMSIMPLLHSPKPFLSCWHFVGSVSASGERRHSAAVCRCTMTHSDSCRHSANAAPIVSALLVKVLRKSKSALTLLDGSIHTDFFT